MQLRIAAYIFFCAFTLASPSHAYLGPGLSTGTVGIILGILASVVVAIIAVVWYPIKRLLNKFTKKEFGDSARR